ncbi:MAG TPA: hypothetical protein DCG12_22315 [Planctomycetaceae bacterium]|nr:hypothetical protein [Planctomycetaceae bacterium]
MALHEKDAAEVWRVLGAFEQLPPAVRRELGDIILQLLPRPKMQAVREALIWTVGRIGARVPFNGNAQSTVSASAAASWLQQLMAMQLDDCQPLPVCIMQLARRTHDRLTDVPAESREEAARFLKEMGGTRNLVKLITKGGETDAETQDAVFGESLPMGLVAG